jgi:glycosyltransferase involved in cell wall biosynthesis
MRIAFIEEDLNISGGMRRIIEISNRLVDKGHDVDIIIALDHASLECDWLEVKANVIHIKDKRDYDVAIFNRIPVWIAMDFIQARLKVYYWLSFEAGYFSGPAWYDAYNYKCFVIANSDWVADMAELVYGKRPPVVYGGIDREFYKPIKTEKKYDIVALAPKDKPEKGYFYVKRVSDLFKLKLNNIQGIPQEDMPRAYSEGEIFLAMPNCEGFYNPALEAMACGVPVILTDTCGKMDYAVDGENCLLIPRHVGHAMLAIKRLQDPKLKEKLIKNGLETVKKYSWDDAGDNFEKVIKKEYDTIIENE